MVKRGHEFDQDDENKRRYDAWKEQQETIAAKAAADVFEAQLKADTAEAAFTKAMAEHADAMEREDFAKAQEILKETSRTSRDFLRNNLKAGSQMRKVQKATSAATSSGGWCLLTLPLIPFALLRGLVARLTSR